MRITVLIPTYNRAALLDQAITSVLRQTRPADEIIVIDDGSKDETPQLMSRYGSAIRGIRQDHGGKSRALNAGIAASSGDATIVLDDDDLQPPNALADHEAILNAHPQAGYCFGRYRRFRGLSYFDPMEDQSPPDLEPVPLDDPRRTLIKLMEVCFLPNPSWMARRWALEAAGPYEETLPRSEDYDMILRLARKDDGAFVDSVVLYQRKHRGNRPGAGVATGAEDNLTAWVENDKRVFERIAKSWSIEDFRLFPGQLSNALEARQAWLQRGVIFFMRKLYDESFKSLQVYRKALGKDQPDEVELKIAAGLLACRYGLQDLTEDGQTSRFVVESLRAGRWPLSMRRAFVREARWRLKAAFEKGGPAAAKPLLGFLIRAFGLAAALGIAVPVNRQWQDLRYGL